MAMKKLRVTVEGRSYDVVVELLGEGQGGGELTASQPTAAASPSASISSRAGGGTPVPSPLAGKVMSLDVREGQSVKEGEQLMVLEAMKMNTYVYSPKAGTVAGIVVQPGDQVEEGQALMSLR